DYLIGYKESSETIRLYLNEGQKHFLQISNIRTDTLVSSMEVTGMSECCVSYDFTNVTLNGQIICDFNCRDVIEIEI
ncbi:MAG TPA: hypothetical protein VMZ69_11565, partial [Saprospiraceae bacterium]|nr:hypothetical protein [Saprospiraceae bacterium]